LVGHADVCLSLDCYCFDQACVGALCQRVTQANGGTFGIALENEAFAPSASARALRRQRAEAWKQFDGVSVHHAGSLDCCEFGGLLEPLDAIHTKVASDVREIRSAQNLVQADDVPQHSQDWVAIGKSRVPIKTPQRVGDGSALLAARNDIHLIDDAPASRQVGRGAAGM